MDDKIQNQQFEAQNLLQNENVPCSDNANMTDNELGFNEGDQKKHPEAQSPIHAQKKGPGNIAFKHKPPISNFSPELRKNQQSSPKIDLSPCNVQSEEPNSNVGVMSSIGLAISNFFTGGKSSPEAEEKKNQEQDQDDDSTIYANEQNIADVRLSNAHPMQYNFADSVAAEHAKKSMMNYNKMESSDSDVDDTNAISYSASFQGDGSIRHINQINTGISFKRQKSQTKVQQQQHNFMVKTGSTPEFQKVSIADKSPVRGDATGSSIMHRLMGRQLSFENDEQMSKIQSFPNPIQSTQPDELELTGSTAMSIQNGRVLTRRGHSKTTYMTAEELAAMNKRLSIPDPQIKKMTKNASTLSSKTPKPALLQFPEPEVPLREIDNIVFNQDKSQFAVIWTEGGFTKFEVASLQVIQQVYKTPQPSSPVKTDEYSLEYGDRQNGLRKILNYPWRRRNIEVEEDDKNKAEKFKCVALQHKTKDYVASLKDKPNQALFVSMNEAEQKTSDPSGQLLFHGSPQKTKEQKYGRRCDVRHFSEEINSIEILPGARYTLFCLETKIYVYSRNSKDLFDIIHCASPTINSAITKELEEKAMIAFLEQKGDGEVVNIRDYGNEFELTYSIVKPFGWGYKVGGLQLDVGGHRICVVSADGCYVYMYAVTDDSVENETIHELDEDELLSPIGNENPYILPEFSKKLVEIQQPIQKFQRGSTSCKEIYQPIQFVHGFSTRDHNRDFVLLSTSSMTTHMFVLSEETDEEKENRDRQQRPGWVSFSRFLPQALTLERSAIRLNVQEEVAPPQNFHPNNLSPKSQAPAAEPKQYPYVCFVETTGLLVIISNSGYCCKFSIELEDEAPVTDLRTQRYNNRRNRLGSRSPVRMRLSINSGAIEEPDSLAKSMTPGVMQSQILNQAINNVVDEFNASGQLQSGARSQVALSQQSLQPQKPKSELAGFKQPILRLKFKINEFFSDKKAESQQRIKKRQLIREKEDLRQEIIRKYNAEQKMRHLTPAERCKQRKAEVIKLSQLLSSEKNSPQKKTNEKKNLIHRPF